MLGLVQDLFRGNGAAGAVGVAEQATCCTSPCTQNVQEKNVGRRTPLPTIMIIYVWVGPGT